MCGIVGYVGKEQAAPILLDGLSKLEYRGYDSAGMAVYDGEKIVIKKATGRLKVLNSLMTEPRCRDILELVIPDGRPMGSHQTSMRIRILTVTRQSPLCITVLLRII